MRLMRDKRCNAIDVQKKRQSNGTTATVMSSRYPPVFASRQPRVAFPEIASAACFACFCVESECAETDGG